MMRVLSAAGSGWKVTEESETSFMTSRVGDVVFAAMLAIQFFILLLMSSLSAPPSANLFFVVLFSWTPQ